MSRKSAGSVYLGRLSDKSRKRVIRRYTKSAPLLGIGVEHGGERIPTWKSTNKVPYTLAFARKILGAADFLA